MENMKYKVGDKVRIKSLYWYNQNKNEDDYVPLIDSTNSYYNFIEEMRGFCNKVMTISSVNSNYYDMVEDAGEYFWTDEMIKGLAEETKPLVFDNSWECPQGYQFVDENGNIINAQKIVLEKKKKEYPKTFEECNRIIGVGIWNTMWGEKATKYYEEQMEDLIIAFIKLKVCRDAYWKIAGEEMGLGKPWETGDCQIVYGICRERGNIVKRDDYFGDTHTLEFPIREMRDAFYINFKVLIEQCKELL